MREFFRDISSDSRQWRQPMPNRWTILSSMSTISWPPCSSAGDLLHLYTDPLQPAASSPGRSPRRSQPCFKLRRGPRCPDRGGPAHRFRRPHVGAQRGHVSPTPRNPRRSGSSPSSSVGTSFMRDPTANLPGAISPWSPPTIPGESTKPTPTARTILARSTTSSMCR